MQGAYFDHVEPTPSFEALPIRIELTTSRAGALVKLALLTPMMILVAVPISMIAAQAGAEQSALDYVMEHPVSSAQIAVGLMMWAALFLIPLKRIIARMGARRVVEISDGWVRVADSSPFGGRTWTAPLASYKGVAHHIRSSLSGNRHELILVHAEPGKSVLVAVADRISQETLDRAKALLGLPELPARALYARG